MKRLTKEELETLSERQKVENPFIVTHALTERLIIQAREAPVLREALQHVRADGENIPECCWDASEHKDLAGHYHELASKTLTAADALWKGGE